MEVWQVRASTSPFVYQELSEFNVGERMVRRKFFFFLNLIGNYCKHGFFLGTVINYSYQVVIGIKHQCSRLQVFCAWYSKMLVPP